MKKYLYVCVFTCIALKSCYGKPATEAPGPCVGPDCYHGQLMHGDKGPGIDHKAEDTYLRIKDELAAGQGKPKPDTPEQLGVGQMEIDIGPQGKEEIKRGPIKPRDAEELMHEGDANVHEHGAKDVKGDKDQIVKRGPIQPVDAEALMHGGDGAAHDHDSQPEKKEGVAQKHPPILPIDAESVMHGDDGKTHDHNKHGKVNKYDFDIEDIKKIEGIGKLLDKVDLEAIMKKNSEEYSKWAKEESKGASAEDDSLWSQIDRMRKQYLSFGATDQDEDEEKRAKRLNPMTSEWEKDLADSRASQKDDIIQSLEMFGDTGRFRPVVGVGNYRANRPTGDHVTHDES